MRVCEWYNSTSELRNTLPAVLYGRYMREGNWCRYLFDESECLFLIWYFSDLLLSTECRLTPTVTTHPFFFAVMPMAASDFEWPLAIAYAHRCGSSLHAFHFDSPASLAVLAVAVVSFILPPKSLSSVLSSKSSQKPRKPMSEYPMKRNDQLLWGRTQVSQARRERNWWRYNDKGRC